MSVVLYVAAALCGLVAVLGTLQSLAAAVAFARFVRQPWPATHGAARASVPLAASILKPLHGRFPALDTALRSCLAQGHAAPAELLLGVHSAQDAAVPVVQPLLGENSALPARLVETVQSDVANRKVGQLVRLAQEAAYPALVVADADILTPPGWLSAVTVPLQQPDVGLVTCLYRGVPEPGLASAVGALGIDWHFLPNAVLGESLGLAKGCYGATMALRRDALQAVGGFEAFTGLLADDNALGAAIRAKALKVVVSPVLVGHAVAETTIGAMWQHELRWARTLRLLDLPGYAGMVLTHPLPFAVLALLFAPGHITAAVALAALLGRLILAVTVDAGLARQALSGPAGWRRLPLLLLRDALSFAIWCAGLFPGRVTWQGRRYRLERDGRMAEAARGGN